MSAPHPSPSDAAEMRRIVRDSGSSFYWPMRLLPRERRTAMHAVYAFCRAVDDIADGPAPAAEKRRALEGWRAELDRVHGGAPRTAVGRALAAAVARFGLARADLAAVIEGVEMDVSGAAHAPDLATLELYCARVAGAVGLLSVRVFGADSEAARRGALALGHAMQLTNILRDLSEDAARGRLYLPREILQRHGIATADPGAATRHPAIGRACAELAAIAETRFGEAERAFAACPRRRLRPALAMMAVYRLLLRRLGDRGWAPLADKPRIGRATLLWTALRAGFA